MGEVFRGHILQSGIHVKRMKITLLLSQRTFHSYGCSRAIRGGLSAYCLSNQGVEIQPFLPKMLFLHFCPAYELSSGNQQFLLMFLFKLVEFDLNIGYQINLTT